MSRILLPMIPSMIFMVLGLTFKSLIHFEFILVTVWMDLENITLSEISQSEKDKYHMISLICGL